MDVHKATISLDYQRLGVRFDLTAVGLRAVIEQACGSDMASYVSEKQRQLDELGYDLREEEQTAPDLDTPLDDDVGDDLLKLIFTSCRPAISPEARVALTLRLGDRLKKVMA